MYVGKESEKSKESPNKVADGLGLSPLERESELKP